ncbi:MAG: hypothetical protein A2Y98_01065 [Candidatus Portnoybacteria bacterium RBG_19FT_COMBO_36_7]|uniref:Aminotransferase class III n=1 Tax=Candidatus Portnoybacteria bacterium RBG_19FT_COMBO_36_7 TaxID=1801992 RepID=A0A1G2F8A4_9BACT|nr:MAG: hypothetical protein A2Y98_01065 [Candidatus Portnoybacteria bacterium RBG_19FT_COMBO_36_7]
MKKKIKYLRELLEYIPSGAQTLSKNPSQYVIGVSPLAIRKAKGAYVWDIDGHKYLDMILGLGPMIFGYANEKIDEAVKKQLDKGTIYSLPSEYELKLAKLLREVVPCAEMSRFVLSGNEATSGAVRLARHITGRDHVAKCGYHGCQDWSICTKEGRNTGVPEIMKTMTHDFDYNDAESLEKIFKKYRGKIAAVILEPVSSERPVNKFLQKVKQITKKHGAILIFDEMVTGFRWALGGAQEYFGVIPDIACFSKAVSNGYPVSIISGKAKYMKKMDEIFVSMTFAGFVPGLVAAIEVIKMMKRNPKVHEYMHKLGEHLIERGNMITGKYALPFQFIGYGPHPVMKINIKDDYLNRLVKTFIYQEMNKAGILFGTSLLIGYVHEKSEIDLVMDVFDSICRKIKEAGDFKNLEKSVEGEVVVPRTVRKIQ